MTMEAKYFIESEKLDEFNDLIEDTLSYFCDEHMVSGELSWILIQALAEAKLAEMRGEIDADQIS